MRVLVIGAHPDDETMLAGGLVAKLAAEGNEITLLCATRGEGGEAGDPPLAPPDRLGELREQELRCAAQALGISEIVFLGYVDPRVEVGGPLFRIDATLEEFSAKIVREIERLRPDLILTHGSDGEYGHPQHIFTHEAVFAALEKVRPWRPQEVLTWTANYGANVNDRATNKSDPADLVLDVTPWYDSKLAAVLCHRSQHDMIKRNRKLADIRDAPRQTESYRRWGPGDGGRGPDPLSLAQGEG